MQQQSHTIQVVPRQLAASSRRKVDQSGALCWRVGDGGAIDVLLVTSRDTGRWIIPKGNIEKREQQHHCAQREALEEAGVKGKIAKRALGYFAYMKDEHAPLVVSVFPLQVQKQLTQFPERDQRRRMWFSATDAADLVDEAELGALLRQIAGPDAPKLFAKAVRLQPSAGA